MVNMYVYNIQAFLAFHLTSLACLYSNANAIAKYMYIVTLLSTVSISSKNENNLVDWLISTSL